MTPHAASRAQWLLRATRLGRHPDRAARSAGLWIATALDATAGARPVLWLTPERARWARLASH
jgi:hypothetical protein